MNAIQAIEANKNFNSEILITVSREPNQEIDGSLPSINGISVYDQGIGFTKENRDSFDTLYSDYKLQQGGKGFGRFVCLKYFEDFSVESTYLEDDKWNDRKFKMGKNQSIIVDEEVKLSTKSNSSTLVKLENLIKKDSLPKKLQSNASFIVEKLLPYFITKDYQCPKIILKEQDESTGIVLNELFNANSGNIKELKLKTNSFKLGSADNEFNFEIRAFKFYSPKNHQSKISLVADKREVTEEPIHNYIPEFSEEFYEKNSDGSNDFTRNFIIKTYVFSDYLDKNVSLERGTFEFKKDSDVLYGISSRDIESKAAEITKESISDEISLRLEKKIQTIQTYVDEQAPWHKTLINDIKFTDFPYNATNGEIEAILQKKKFEKEQIIRNKVEIILSGNSDNFSEDVGNIVDAISDSSKSDLIHYIAVRRKVLDLFKKSLELKDDGKYNSEKLVHDIIFPTKSDSDTLDYEKHNLWIIDERLNFTNYITSDLPLNSGNSERPDLIIYNKRVAFRGDNEPSNPITIFEFKKPNRDDFVNPSSSEDPVQQIVRYVNNIRNDKFKTPTGKKIYVADNTPFYGYVVCELSNKVEEWLKTEKNFKPMPDRMGWFQWYENINLYIEVLSWDKLLKDAEMRNRIFFHHLGI